MSKYSYSILPYLYTQFFTAHVTGMPVARALFFEFPADDNCLEIDAQYLLGASLLLLADSVSRTVVSPAELPIGIVTAAVGAPFFLWMLLRRRGLLDL